MLILQKGYFPDKTPHTIQFVYECRSFPRYTAKTCYPYKMATANTFELELRHRHQIGL